MTERRQIFEIYDRRQVYDRINELKSSCQNMTHTRDSLLSRLSELNEAVDRLIAEKKNGQYDQQTTSDLFGDRASRAPIYQNRDAPSYDAQKFTSATNDLNDRYKFSSRHKQELIASPKSTPSDAFKTKLSLCLHEVVHKAEEIVELSENLPSKNDTFYLPKTK